MRSDDQEHPERRQRNEVFVEKGRREHRRASRSPDRPRRYRDRSPPTDAVRDNRERERRDARNAGRYDAFRSGARDRSRSPDGGRRHRGENKVLHSYETHLHDPVSPPKRHRSRSPLTNRPPPDRLRGTRSSDKSRGEAANQRTESKAQLAASERLSMNALQNEDDEVTFMNKIMGFSGFRSTKNTKVPGNNVGAVRKDKQVKARQYMNRVGGFNRPLSPGR